MKLKELLKVITHQNYTVYVQNPFGVIQLENTEEIKNHLDFEVVGVNENWEIILKNDKLF